MARTRRRGYPQPVNEILDDRKAEQHQEEFKDSKYGKRGNAPKVKGGRRK